MVHGSPEQSTEQVVRDFAERPLRVLLGTNHETGCKAILSAIRALGSSRIESALASIDVCVEAFKKLEPRRFEADQIGDRALVIEAILRELLDVAKLIEELPNKDPAAARSVH